MSELTPKQEIEQLKKKVNILTQLAEISESLNSRVNLDLLLNHIMDVAVEITECEAASVLLWNAKTHQLFFAASTSKSADGLIGKPIPMDSIAGTALTQNKIIQVDNARNDPRHYDQVDSDIQFVTQSLLTVPMTYKDKVIGVVQALNKKQLPWTQDDRHYLGILSSQAAVAIEGAQLVMELRHANNELQEVDKLKNDFIAIASHELRTPLGVIMGYASFLQEETMSDPEAAEHANKVMESALKLRQIIEDMVNLRYLKQNQQDLMRENLTLGELLQGIEQVTLQMIDVNHYDFKVVLPQTDVIVNIDTKRLSMAVNNLINNAIAFTPPGGAITIQTEVKNNDVVLSVIDTGVGLEKDQLERIFTEFYQVEDYMTRRHGGLGIGLSITRAIIAAHGGRIWAESEGKSKGARFNFTLPIIRKH
jgi:signal transduction histidine kinase